MNKSLFREKSIQRIQSPENLNEYIQVSNPGIWIIMVSIAFILFGLCIWGCFGELKTVVHGKAVSENGAVSFYTFEESDSEIKPGMSVDLGGQKGTISKVSDNVCIVEMDESLPDGTYSGEVLVEAIHPISFLFN